MNNFPIKGTHKGFWKQSHDPDTEEMNVEPPSHWTMPPPEKEQPRRTRQKRDQPDPRKMKKPAVAVPRINAFTGEEESEEKQTEKFEPWVPRRKSKSELDDVDKYTEEDLEQMKRELATVMAKTEDQGPNARGASCQIV